MVRGELKPVSRSGWAGSLPWRALLAELGKERGPPFPEGGELSTQLFQSPFSIVEVHVRPLSTDG